MRAKMAAWAAGGIWSQSSAGIGGTGGMSIFYGQERHGQVRGVNGYRGDVGAGVTEAAAPVTAAGVRHGGAVPDASPHAGERDVTPGGRPANRTAGRGSVAME